MYFINSINHTSLKVKLMAKRPKICPNCNSPRKAKIVYGLPNYDNKMAKDISEDRRLLH